MKTKICRHCNEEKPITDFKEQTGPMKRLSEKTGKTYLKSYCIECDRVMTIERQKKSYQKLKEKRLAYQKEYDRANFLKRRKRRNEYSREYYYANKDKYREYARKWRAARKSAA